MTTHRALDILPINQSLLPTHAILVLTTFSMKMVSQLLLFMDLRLLLIQTQWAGMRQCVTLTANSG